MLGRGRLSSTRGLGGGLSSAKLPLLLLLMVGKASGAGLSLTLGFSPGLPQPQDCPRFLDSLEVESYFPPIHFIYKIISPPQPSYFIFYILHGNCFESIWRKGCMRKACPSDWWWQNQQFASRIKIVQILGQGKVCEYFPQPRQIRQNNANQMWIASQISHLIIWGEKSSCLSPL